MNAPVTGIIDIRGKSYQTVALRVQTFRERHPDHTLSTEIVDRNDEYVIVKATIAANGLVLATGHAEEYRKSSQINRTSALENAETSAIGRALAAYGFGGTEFASANEVQNAIHQQGARQDYGDNASNGEVSPGPAKRAPAWDTPIKNKSNLHKAMMALERELAGCGDSDMVYGVTATQEWRDFVTTAEVHAPHYLRGGEPAPEEFEGLLSKAERLVREFDSATARNVADLARA